MPHARLDHGALALAKNACPPVELHGQFALKHGETLDKSGMAVFAENLRSDERGQLCGRATRGILDGEARGSSRARG